MIDWWMTEPSGQGDPLSVGTRYVRRVLAISLHSTHTYSHIYNDTHTYTHI